MNVQRRWRSLCEKCSLSCTHLNVRNLWGFGIETCKREKSRVLQSRRPLERKSFPVGCLFLSSSFWDGILLLACEREKWPIFHPDLRTGDWSTTLAIWQPGDNSQRQTLLLQQRLLFLYVSSHCVPPWMQIYCPNMDIYAAFRCFCILFNIWIDRQMNIEWKKVV